MTGGIPRSCASLAAREPWAGVSFQKEQPLQHPQAHTGMLPLQRASPLGKGGTGAAEVPRAGSWAVPTSQGWLLPSAAQLMSQGSPSAFPSAFQNCGAQTGVYMLGRMFGLRVTGETEALG